MPAWLLCICYLCWYVRVMHNCGSYFCKLGNNWRKNLNMLTSPLRDWSTVVQAKCRWTLVEWMNETDRNSLPRGCSIHWQLYADFFSPGAVPHCCCRTKTRGYTLQAEGTHSKIFIVALFEKQRLIRAS